MIVVGLTGSIGMGKSTAAAALKGMGLPIHDSDAVVHRLLAPGGGAVAAVLARFPGVGSAEGGIDRQALGRRVFGDGPALKALEGILHPRVQAEKQRFLAQCRRRRLPLAILDIPLLYETGGERGCDAVLVVTAPAFLQRARVMARTGMTGDKLAAILAKQMPDREKRRRTPYVVQTGLGKRHGRAQLRRFISRIKEREVTPNA